MDLHVVLFEDQSLLNFRPLAASVPLYEMRLGMFNTRERLEMSLGAGTLLCREILAPLHTCQAWAINPPALPEHLSQETRVLWFSGRLNLGLHELQAFAPTGTDWAFEDECGLVAAELSLQDSRHLLDSWRIWQTGPAQGGIPAERWSPELRNLSGSDEKRALPALKFIWDLVPATSEALNLDLAFVGKGHTWSRTPFGLFPDPKNPKPLWLETTFLERSKRKVRGEGGLFLAPDVDLADDVAIDTTAGPVILDRGVKVMPHCFLEGPLYVGPCSLIKAGATLYGESSFGIGNRLAGEIGESTFADFANKQHDGFIGHAVIGSWTNLGAMTTCSDLKNNYGPVRVDLGSGTVQTGLRFVGLMLGDHVKTAIGTLFNTGTVVGFASNIFGGVMPPKFVPHYSWGGLPESPSYEVHRALETAEVVMNRRGCVMSEAARHLMRLLV